MSKVISLTAALSVALLQSGCASTDGDNSGMQLFQQVVGIASMAVGTMTRNENLTNQGQSLLDQSFNQTTTPPPAPAYSPTPAAYTPPPATSGTSGQTYAAANPNQLVFQVRSLHPNAVELVFYSQSRQGHQWPGGSQVYVLRDSQYHTHSLSCNAGEKVCYGAWVMGSGNPVWGAGRGGGRACTNCCAICGNATIPQTLNP